MKKWFSGLRLKILLLMVVPIFALAIVGGLGLGHLDVITLKRMPLSYSLGETKADLENIPRFLWLAYANRDKPDIRALGLKQAGVSLVDLRKHAQDFYEGPLLMAGKKNFEPAFLDIEKIEAMYKKVKPLLETLSEEDDQRARQIMNAELLKPALNLGEIIEKSEKILLDANKKMVD